MSSLTLKSLRKLTIRGVISPSDYIKAKHLKRLSYTPLHERSEFDLLSFCDRESNLLFRFTPEEILRLTKALGVSKTVKLKNGGRVPGREALCILLRRLCHPNRLSDLCKLFGRDTTILSRAVTFMTRWLYGKYSSRLKCLKQPWMCEGVWNRFAEDLPSYLSTFCGPKKYYSGYYKEHVIKYQGIMLPNGIMGRLDGAFVGCRHDSAIIHLTGLIGEMERELTNNDGTWFAVYRDSGYANQKFIKVGYKNAKSLTDAQKKFNNDIASLRIGVEWGFGKVVNLFAFLDFRKNQKVLLQPLKQQYFVATFLTNCHTCLRGSQGIDYFSCQPPTLEQYIQGMES